MNEPPTQLHPKPKIPKPTKGLRAEGRKLWRNILGAYSFDEAPEKLIILESACREADVTARIQELVDSDDTLRVKGSQGQPVSAPEVAELRMHRALLNQLIKSMMLPDEEDERGGLTRSEIGRIGARARWGGVTR